MGKNRIFYGWYIVTGSFLILFAAFGIAYLSIGLYVTPICEAFGFSRGQFAITMSLVGIFMGVGSFFAGIVFKKIGIKTAMVIGGTLIATGLLLMSFSQKLYLFYIAGSMIGIGNAIGTNIPVCIIINNWFKEKRGFVLGIVLSASGFGGMAFSPVIAYVIQRYSYHTSLLISAILVVFIIIPIVVFVIKEEPENKGLKAYGDGNKDKDNNVRVNYGLTLYEAIKTPSFYLVMISTLGFVICLASSIFYVPSFLTDIGIDPVITGTILSVLYTLNAVGKLIMGRINDKFGIKVCIFYGATLFIVSMGITFYITTPLIAFIFAIIYGLSNPVGSLPITIVTSEIFGDKDYLSILPIMQSVAGIGSALVTPVIGLIYDRLGSYQLIFIIFSIIAIISIVITQFAFQLRPKFSQKI